MRMYILSYYEEDMRTIFTPLVTALLKLHCL